MEWMVDIEKITIFSFIVEINGRRGHGGLRPRPPSPPIIDLIQSM